MVLNVIEEDLKQEEFDMLEKIHSISIFIGNVGELVYQDGV